MSNMVKFKAAILSTCIHRHFPLYDRPTKSGVKIRIKYRFGQMSNLKSWHRIKNIVHPLPDAVSAIYMSLKLTKLLTRRPKIMRGTNPVKVKVTAPPSSSLLSPPSCIWQSNHFKLDSTKGQNIQILVLFLENIRRVWKCVVCCRSPCKIDKHFSRHFYGL